MDVDDLEVNQVLELASSSPLRNLETVRTYRSHLLIAPAFFLIPVFDENSFRIFTDNCYDSMLPDSRVPDRDGGKTHVTSSRLRFPMEHHDIPLPCKIFISRLSVPTIPCH